MSGVRRTAIVVSGGIIVGGLLVAAPSAYTSGTTVVQPGQSIQAAVNSAHPGDTIKLKAGTYSGGIRVTTTGLTSECAGARTKLVPGGTDNCAPDVAGSGICVVAGTSRVPASIFRI